MMSPGDAEDHDVHPRLSLPTPMVAWAAEREDKGNGPQPPSPRRRGTAHQSGYYAPRTVSVAFRYTYTPTARIHDHSTRHNKLSYDTHGQLTGVQYRISSQTAYTYDAW
jgi:hypothetical protein